MVEDRDDRGEMDGGINRFEGRIDKLVQAGQVHGSINVFHAPPERPKAPPHQIGLPVRPYTNNKLQLREATELLTPAEQDGPPRIALVCGGPGSGRSALTTEVANELAPQFPDGVFVARLGIRDDELVRVRLGEWLSAVGYDIDQVPASLEGRAGMWRTWSKGKQLLLVVDDAVTKAQVETLLPGPGRSAVAVVRSASMNGLVERDREVHMEPMSDESARALLSKLATTVDLEANPDAIAALLERCEGSVIALRAVGLLLEDIPPVRLAEKLGDAERALRALSRFEDVAVEAVFDAAYDRLRANGLAQECYRFLGVHPSGAGVTADVVGVILGRDADDAEFALNELVRVGLAVRIEPERYEIASNLVRPHASTLLKRAGENETVRRRIVSCYLDRALACSRAWMPGRIWLGEIWGDELPAPEPDPETARAWLRAERSNLREAVKIAYGLGELESVCKLAVALWPLHDQDKHTLDMINVCGRAAEAADEARMPLAASLVRQQLAFGHRELREFAKASEALEAAIRDAQEANSELAYYSAMEVLGLVLREQGRSEQSWRLLKENHEFAKSGDDRRRAALAAFHFATVARDEAETESLFETAAAELHEEPYNLAKIALWRGRRLVDFGRQEEAAEALADAAERTKNGGWHNERVLACRVLAHLARMRGEVETERLHLTTALEIAQIRGFGAHSDEIIDRLDELPPLPQ